MPARLSNGDLAYYQDRPATAQDIAVAIARLTANFGEKDAAFQNQLAQRIAANHFTAQRLNDAVNNLLDTGVYNYKISDIIRYNISFKTFSQNEVYKAARQYPSPYYPLIELNGQTYHVKREDATKYNLKVVRDYAEY